MPIASQQVCRPGNQRNPCSNEITMVVIMCTTITRISCAYLGKFAACLTSLKSLFNQQYLALYQLLLRVKLVYTIASEDLDACL